MINHVIFFTKYAVLLGMILMCSTIVRATDITLASTWCNDLQYPTRITCDSVTHYVYVTSPRLGQIAVFNQVGTVVNIITTVAHPSAIAVDGLGNLFVSDGQAVRKLGTDGTPLLVVGGAETYFLNPHDVAVGADGRIYVSDVNDTIKVFDAAGVFQSSFGRHGYFAGRLDEPVALAVNSNSNEVYVSDQNNCRTNVYTTNGVFLRSWGSIGNGNYASSQYLREWGIDVDAMGRIWTYDELLNALQVYDATGTFLFMCRLHEPELKTAMDIAVDGDRLYIAAQSTHCILVYSISETGQLPEPIDCQLTIRFVPEGLKLQWSAVPDAISYQIIRSEDPLFISGFVETIGTTSSLSFVDTNAESQWDKRFYQVRAILLSDCGNSRRQGSSADMTELRDHADHTTDTHHDAPHTIQNEVTCASCHFSNLAYPNPLPEWWFGDQLCLGCHVETGKAQPQQNHFSATDTMYCNTCHNPHFQQQPYPHQYIRDVISTPHNGDRIVLFNNATDFIHGAPNFDGICEVCHTQTTYHRNNNSGDHSHNTGTSCTTCHLHVNGFEPQSGS